MADAPLTQAYADLLVRKSVAHVANGLSQKGRLFAALPKIPPNLIPGYAQGSIADETGFRYRVVYEGNTSAAEVLPGENLPTPGAAKHVELAFPFAAFDVSTEVSHLQLEQWRNAAPDGLVVPDELRIQQDQALRSVVDVIDGKLFSGSGDRRLQGFAIQVAADGSYGGQLRSTYPVLQCHVAANSGSARAISETILDAAFAYMRDSKASGAGFIGITSETQRNKIARLTNSTTNMAQYADGQAPSKQLGYGRVFYGDAEIFAFPGATSGAVYFVNPDAVSIVYLPTAAPEAPDLAWLHALPVQQVGDRFIMRHRAYLQMVIAGGGGIGREAFVIKDLS